MQIEDKEKIERPLVGRLKILGYILLGFSMAAIAWPLIPEIEKDEEILAGEILPELAEPPPINAYLAGAAFALVGTACLLIAWRKKNAFQPENSIR